MKYWVGVTDNGWFDYLSRANVVKSTSGSHAGRSASLGYNYRQARLPH
jgi:hypothetical protein